MANLKNYLIAVWPTIYKLVQRFIYFVLGLIKSFFKLAKEEITG